MCVPKPKRGRAAQRVVQRVVHHVARRCRVAAGFASALVSSGALLGACIEERQLFAEYVTSDPDVAGAGGANVTDGGADVADVLVPSYPEKPSEAPPFDAELGATGGAAGAGNPDLPTDACEPPDAGVRPPICAPPPLADEGCNACLASECPDAIATCRATPGCEAISACAQRTGCVDDECYCGTVNLIVCAATGAGNGPCREVALAAPESHEPTPAVPNAGPAAEAARSVGICRRASASCGPKCGS
jgi:hypothetical protein